MNNMKSTSRRRFLKRSAAASATVLGASLGYAPWLRAAGANNDIRVAVVGLGSTVKNGGKGKRDLRDFRKIPGVRVVAVCDVDSAILGAEVEQLKKENHKVEAYADVRRLLENKDIDAVTVTTPNHWHALVTVWACQAGKDVFVQKPASYSIFEGRKMVEAARKYERIVVCANASRSPSGFKEALDYVQQGHLGKLLLVRGLNYRPRTSIGQAGGVQPVPASLDYDLWSGPAPMAPLRRRHLHYDWHWDWLTGNGDLGNMGIHNLDGCRMAVGDRLPRHAISIGGRFGYADDGQTPNTQLMFFDYEPAPILFEVRGLPKNKSFMKGPLVDQDDWGGGEKSMDSYLGVAIGKVIHCENGYVIGNKAFGKDGTLIKEFQPATPDVNRNFVETMRSRRTGDLVADILQGHLSAALVHLANISHRVGRTMPDGEIRQRIEGRKELAAAYDAMQAHLLANGIDLDKTPATLGALLTIDPDTERFVGEFSEAANKLLSRDFRPPFVVPWQV